MTTVFLVRHGSHQMQGRILVGRMNGVHLSQEGRIQAKLLAAHFSDANIVAIYSSPLDRTLETAQLTADKVNLPIHIEEDANEVDFGRWTGLDLIELRKTPAWNDRARMRFPAGETMDEVRSRIIALISKVCSLCIGGNIVIFTHGDVIKVALCHYIGKEIDTMSNISINPGSISSISIIMDKVTVLSVNQAPTTLI